MAFVLGIDVGSGYSKAVVCEDTSIRSFAVMPSGGDYKEIARTVGTKALSEIGLPLKEVAYTVAAGYGASMVDFADHSLTDISCHAIGVHHFFPSVKTVIDVGAQFSRAIRLDNDGRIANFILNDFPNSQPLWTLFNNNIF
jgi:activator of 2-hydroxyglutaryl-CoA dehydratase